MDKITFANRQELTNAVCRKYVDFCEFDIKAMDFNDFMYDTLCKFGSRLHELQQCLNRRKNCGKYCVVWNKESAVIMAVNKENRDKIAESRFEFVISDSKENNVEYVCYIIDFDALTVEEINVPENLLAG